MKKLEELRKQSAPHAGLQLMIPDGISLDQPQQQQLGNAADLELPSSATKESAGQPLLERPRSCYICKARFRELHAFYDQLCPSCAELNYAKRHQTADLRGRIAVVTGARVKIGFQVQRSVRSRLSFREMTAAIPLPISLPPCHALPLSWPPPYLTTYLPTYLPPSLPPALSPFLFPSLPACLSFSLSISLSPSLPISLSLSLPPSLSLSLPPPSHSPPPHLLPRSLFLYPSPSHLPRASRTHPGP